MDPLNPFEAAERAIVREDPAALRALLDMGLPPGVLGEPSQRALIHSACHVGSAACLALLLERGAEPLPFGASSLAHLAATAGSSACLEILSARGLNMSGLDRHRQTPLQSALFAGHAECSKWLIERGAPLDNADVDQWTPAMAAASCCGEALRFLGAAGFDLTAPTLHGLSLATLCLVNGNVEGLKALSGFGVDLDPPGDWTLLHFAAWNKQEHCLRFLLDAGLDPNAINDAGKTPAMLCAGQGFMEGLGALAERGADLEALDAEGFSCLERARAQSDPQLVALIQALIDRQALEGAAPEKRVKKSSPRI
jgi:ankyrin repeat protein